LYRDQLLFADTSIGATSYQLLFADTSIGATNKKTAFWFDYFMQQSEDILVNIFALLFMWVFC
jgi:hypothetical protein